MSAPPRASLVICLVGMIFFGACATSGTRQAALSVRSAAVVADAPLVTTTSTTLDPASQIMANLRAAHEEWDSSFADPDPANPKIGILITGMQLMALRAFLGYLRDKHQGSRGRQIDYRMTVTSITGDTATVDECRSPVRRADIFDLRTGLPIATPAPGASFDANGKYIGPVTTHFSNGSKMTMQREGGVWKWALDEDKPEACR